MNKQVQHDDNPYEFIGLLTTMMSPYEFMWWLMMIAMMLPRAAPTLLLFHSLKKLGSEAQRALGQTYLFLLGYLGTCAFFSVVACLLQAQLEANNLARPMIMQSTSSYLSGALLLIAGIYQFTTLKTYAWTNAAVLRNS